MVSQVTMSGFVVCHGLWVTLVDRDEVDGFWIGHRKILPTVSTLQHEIRYGWAKSVTFD